MKEEEKMSSCSILLINERINTFSFPTVNGHFIVKLLSHHFEFVTIGSHNVVSLMYRLLDLNMLSSFVSSYKIFIKLRKFKSTEYFLRS